MGRYAWLAVPAVAVAALVVLVVSQLAFPGDEPHPNDGRVVVPGVLAMSDVAEDDPLVADAIFLRDELRAGQLSDVATEEVGESWGRFSFGEPTWIHITPDAPPGEPVLDGYWSWEGDERLADPGFVRRVLDELRADGLHVVGPDCPAPTGAERNRLVVAGTVELPSGPAEMYGDVLITGATDRLEAISLHLAVGETPAAWRECASRFGSDPNRDVGRWALSGPVTGFDNWTAPSGPIVDVEAHCPSSWLDDLSRRGHRVRSVPAYASSFGHAHAIVVEEHGVQAGCADPRAVVSSCAAL